MTATVTLRQAEIEAAIAAYLKEKGFSMRGNAKFRTDIGDAREPGNGTTATVEAEPINQVSQR